MNITLNACLFIYDKKREEEKTFQRGEYDSDQSDSMMMKNKKNSLTGCFCSLKFRCDKVGKNKCNDHQRKMKSKHLTKLKRNLILFVN